MEPRALRRLLAILRESGVTHYKTADVDITLDADYRLPAEVAGMPVEQSDKIPVTSDGPRDPLMFFHERMGS